jgi:gliding motility-associated-like protein
MPKLKLKLLSGLLFVLLFMGKAYSQTSYSGKNWYFGNSVFGIRFNRPNQTATLDSTNMAPPFERFGNATASEPETGNLLFYTDGQFVYDGNFQFMDGIVISNPSFLLNANVNKNQNTAIISTPGNDDRYIIFTNTPSNAVNYSIVDMTSPGNAIFPQPPLGSVITFNQPIPASTATASDAMLALAKADLSGYWLITVDQGSSTYKVLNIDGANPAGWTEQSFNLGIPLNAANLSFSAASGKIAVAPSSSNTNIQILNFDDITGILTFDTEILNSGNADQATEAIYDTEWSPDGTKLYIARFGGAAAVGDLLQWDSTLPPTSSLISVLPAPVFGSYGLQMGPDGNIYHLYQEFNGGPYIVGSIGDADSTAILVQYGTTVFANQDFNSQQFPALLPPRQIMLNLDFSFAGTCANSPTTFYPIISPAADFVAWDFGDGATSNQLSPIYTYTSGSTYTVTLAAMLNGQIDTVQKQVTITQFDLQLNLASDTIACQCELPKYMDPNCTPFSVTVQASNPPAGVTYLWSNGDTGVTLTPDSAGYYYVIATDPLSGCSAYAGVNVQEYGALDQRANVWYFGNLAGIDFNPPTIDALNDSQMNAPEGCTAISDRNGVIVFYTDGNDVFVKDKVTGVHSLVDTGIGGSPGSAQSVIGVPFPNDETLFYIFTTEEVGTGTGNFAFKFSVFDLKLNNGAGGIAKKNITLFTKSTERITANNNWVLIHEYGNNNFRAYPLTTTGLGNAVVSSMGSDHSTSSSTFAQGYMKFSGDGTKLAVALAESATGPNYVDVFAWDNAIGEVTDFRQMDLTADGASLGQVYGVEFSPGGNKLFATVKTASSSTIMEYRADTLSLMHHITPIMASGSELGAIQIAPTGQMFVAANGSGNLGVINLDSDTATASTYSPNGFPLAGGTTSNLGLPNFAQNFGNSLATPSYFVSTPVCVGQPINMSAITTSVIDTAFWQIADALGNTVFTTQNLIDTTTLNVAGDYLVSLLIGNRCGFNVAFSQTVTVSPPPQTSTLPAGIPLCGTSSLLEVYNVPPPNIADLTFLWSTGDTTSSIVVTSPGIFDIVVTDATTGCTTNTSVIVGPPFLVDLGPDQNLCENDPLILDSQANANTYSWFINNAAVAPANNQRTFDFGAQTLAGGVYTVRVEIVDPIDPNCIVIDEVIITVNTQPIIGSPIVTPTVCGNSDGIIDFTITNAGTGSYTFDLTGPVSLVNQPIVAGAGTVPNLPAGIYIITVYNLVSGCSNTLGGVIVDNNPPLFNIIPDPPVTTPDGCDPNVPSGTIRVVIDNAAAFPIDYILRDEATNTIVQQANNIPDAGAMDFTITGLTDGTYAIELDPTGCTVFANGIIVAPTPVSDLQVNNTLSGCNNIDLNALGIISSTGADITWSYDDLTYFPLDTLVDPANDAGSFGQFDLFILARDPANLLCDSLRQIPVTLVPTPAVNPIEIDSTNICNGSILLTGNATETFPGEQLDYRWAPTGETTPTIVATQNGVRYTVTISNSLNQSCSSTAFFDVQIPPSFTVSLSSTLACDDGKPFTLSAVATNSDVDYAWTLNGVDLPDITSQIQSITAGTFEVTVTDRGPGACSNAASLEVIKAPVTPTNLSSAPVFCPDEGDIILDAGPNFISYLWLETGEVTQTIDVSTGGLYRVMATNNFNCVTNDQSQVLEDCIPKVYGPTAFRPGGLNAEFFLFTEYIKDFEIFIFNRWGNMVYQSNEIDFKWDGTLDGELLPAAQYSWVVRYTSSFRDRGTLEQYGGVVLLR